jgi:acyl-coenzyme A synthetase/AMP-(fatty) acid ligase
VLVNYFNFGLWTAAAYGSSILIWIYGQTVVIHQGPDPHRSLSLPGLAYAVTTPALLARIMGAPPGSFPRNDDLQLSVLGGALSATLYNQVRARLTHKITTSVGSTEAGTWAVTEVESIGDLKWHKLTPGREVEVVDDHDRPLPAGALGQVRVKREDGADSYVGDPAATAAFFRGDFFYPGDLGVLDGKGRLALYGRVTDVLNVMGDKLPAAPIEQALEEALGVSAVCALSEQDADQAEALHIVIETPGPIEDARLRAASDAHLRGFPHAHFHFIDALPRNAMGKIERLTLKRRLIERRLAKAGVAPA